MVYSGLALSGTGYWLLCDGPFTYDDFVAVLLATKDQTAPVYLSTFDDGRWTRLGRDVAGLEVVLNPKGKSSSPPERFIENLSRCIGVVEGGALLGTTETVGTMSFTRPTLYVFPAGDNGSSLFFGIRDLSVVCDAGVGRRPAFWDFLRHFGHLDVLIGTHAGADNIFGLETFVERQSSGELQLLPKLGHVIFNGSPEAVTVKAPDSPTLLVHLPEEVTKMTSMLHDIGMPPHACTSPVGGKTAQKVNLYHKINQGSVDLYVAHPIEDSRELKEFRRQCSSHAANFVSASAVPLTNMVSIVAALVWKPRSSAEKPVRIFLPGSAPLAKLYEALDRLQGVPLFETLSGSAEEPAPRATPVTKPGSSKPAAKLTGTGRKSLPPSMPAAKPLAVPAKTRGQAPRSVSSPKGNREVAGRKSTSKPEPAGKLGHAAKPSQSTHPTPANEKGKRAVETAASSKMQMSLETSAVDTESPADKSSCTELAETVHNVKVEEPQEQGLEDVAARESVERDSLEASVDDNVMAADSLCGDDKDHFELHGEEEFDENKVTQVEITNESEYGETMHKDEDVNAEGVDADDQVIPELDDRSPLLDIPSTGNAEQPDPAGELDTLPSAKDIEIVAEPSEEASVPLDDNAPLREDVHSRPVDTVDVDVETPYDKQIGSDELVDSEHSKIPQETARGVEPDEVAEHQDVGCEFGNGYSSNLPSSEKELPVELQTVAQEESEPPLHDHLQQFQTVQAAESVPDERADEPTDDGKREDVEVADNEASHELEKEVDADRETVTSSITPQGLPSPQKEAEWLETEQEDPMADASPEDEAVDAGHSLKPVDEGEVLENLAAARLSTCEDEGSEKIPQDDMIMSTAARDGLDELERPEDQQTAGITTTGGVSAVQQLNEGSVEKSDVESEVQRSEDITARTDLPVDEQNTDAAVRSNVQTEVDFTDSSDKPSPDADELPSPVEELHSEVQHSEDITAEMDLPVDEKNEQHAAAALPDNLQPEVDLVDFSDKPSPDADELPLEDLAVEELRTEAQEENAAPDDSESHIEPSDNRPGSEELTNPAVNTEIGETDVVPVHSKEQQVEKHEECPVKTEPFSFGLAEPSDKVDDDVGSDTNIPDTVNITDDVPISPVEQSAPEDNRQKGEQMSFYYTEPQIQLTEDVDHTSDVELPVAASGSAAGTDDDGQSDKVEEPHKESSSTDAVPEPFDPIESWGPPMGLPAPLSNESKAGGKKHESKDAAAHGAKQHTSLLAPNTAKSASSSKTGAARDLSGGRNGRTSAKPGKTAERPAARRSNVSATDGSKVGNLWTHINQVIFS